MLTLLGREVRKSRRSCVLSVELVCSQASICEREGTALESTQPSETTAVTLSTF